MSLIHKNKINYGISILCIWLLKKKVKNGEKGKGKKGKVANS